MQYHDDVECWIFGNIISIMIIEDKLFTGAITVRLIIKIIISARSFDNKQPVCVEFRDRYFNIQV